MQTKKERLFIHVAANVIIIIVVAVILFGSLTGIGTILASTKNKAIYLGNSEAERVSLMVNVYWGTEYIEGMLEAFEAYGVTTTFFLGGSWASANPELVQRMHEKGHELGNHGYLHKDHKNLSIKQNEDEILVTERLIEKIAGVRTNLFAPPSGSLGSNMFTVCEQNNYKVIMWSKDTIDWRDKDSDLVYKRATSNTQKGDLILMHPTAHTLEALPKILQYFKESNFKVTTVSENISAIAS